MEVTKSAAETSVAPNIDLGTWSKEDKEEYYLAVEIKRTPFDGVLKPLNILQGMIWDDIIYNFVLKTSKSIRSAWKAMPGENKKALHHRFAIKYGSEEEMKAFRDEVYNMSITKQVMGNTKDIISRAFRRIPAKKRKTLSDLDAGTLSSFEKFVFRLSQFGILLVLPIEKDAPEDDFSDMEENTEA